MPTMLSRRAYAKRNNISERRVRTLISEGVLANAVDPDSNLIDADNADRLLANHITKPKVGKQPVILQAAKLRRARAVARDLQDEVDDLSRALVPPGWAEQYINGLLAEVTSIIRQWPEKIAPSLLGLTGYEAQRALKQGVDALLGELHEAFKDEAPAPEEAPEPDLDRMTPIEMAAHTENLRARLLELARWERQRKLVRADDVNDIYIEALTISKMLMRAIPGRTDQFVAGAKNVEEVIAILNREVDGIAAVMHIDVGPLTKE